MSYNSYPLIPQCVIDSIIIFAMYGQQFWYRSYQQVLFFLRYIWTGQFFSKSCVPGVLNEKYNTYGSNPMNLCEACASGGTDRCKRNSEELYYGNSGAFRCLTECNLEKWKDDLLNVNQGAPQTKQSLVIQNHTGAGKMTLARNIQIENNIPIKNA